MLSVNNFASYFLEEIETVIYKNSHFPPPNLLNYLISFLALSFLPIIWKNYFCSYPRPASPFVLQIPPLSTSCSLFPLLYQEFLSGLFSLAECALMFLNFNYYRVLTPHPSPDPDSFYSPLFKLLVRIVCSGHCSSSYHILSSIYSTCASIPTVA